MRKSRCDCEVYNDIDAEIVNVFRVLRDPSTAELLRRATTLTPYAKAEHHLSYVPATDPVEQPRRTLFRAYSSYSGASKRMTGMRPTLGARGNRPELDWRGWPSNVALFCDRLSTVQIDCVDALDLIRKYDRADTLFYVDPPYPHSTRTMVRSESHFHYSVEMSDDDHRNLAGLLGSLAGAVVLSGYACSLYDRELYPDWERRERKGVRCNGAANRTEVLWIKPAGTQFDVPVSRIQGSLSLGASNG